MTQRLRIIPIHENPRKRKAKPARARKAKRRSPPPTSRRKSKKRARAGAGSVASFKSLTDAKTFGQSWADKHRVQVKLTGKRGCYYVVPVRA